MLPRRGVLTSVTPYDVKTQLLVKNRTDRDMRLYWPKETPPSILPPGEGSWQPPGIKRAA